ncbi:MAG: hypothetical protein N2169_02575 [bacterium]|nr:hypothetical protein [bacterium]
MKSEKSGNSKMLKTYNIETNHSLNPFINYYLFEKGTLMWYIKEKFPLYFYPLIPLKFLILRSLIPIEIEIIENSFLINSLKPIKYKITRNMLGIYKIKNNTPPQKEITIPYFLYMYIPKIKIQNNTYSIKREYFSIFPYQAKYIFYKNQEPISEILVIPKEGRTKVSTNINIVSTDEEDTELSLIISLIITLGYNYR